MQKRGKLFKLLISIDPFFAVLLLNSHEDQTISGWVGYRALMIGERRYRLAEKVINFLFLPFEKITVLSQSNGTGLKDE